jgi:uncharacterized membrane protein
LKQVVMLVFPTRGTLVDAAERIRAFDAVKIRHSAVIAKAEDGETVILEDDINPDEGSIAGGTLGALMGALGVAGLGAFLLPGVGAILAIGAGALFGGLIGGATGGITAGLIDLGFKNDQLEALATRLNAGHAALVIELEGEAAELEALRALLADYAPEYITPVS